LLFDPPLLLFSFPLSSGKSWESSTTTGTYAYRAESPIQLATAGGLYEVVPVTQSNAPGIPFLSVWSLAVGSGRAVIYYSGDVGQIVKHEAFDTQGAKLGEVALVSPQELRPFPSFVLPMAIVSASSIGAAVVVSLIRRRGKRDVNDRTGNGT
jgi:hypothetical protein